MSTPRHFIESCSRIPARWVLPLGAAAALAIAVLAPSPGALAQDKGGAVPTKPAGTPPGKPAQAGPAKPAQKPAGKPAQGPPGKPAPASSTSPAGSAAAGKSFSIPAFRQISALWNDGADVLVVAGDGRAARIERNGAAIQGKGPERACCVAGRGAGASAEIAVVGTHGGVARFRGGAWDYALAPALDGEDLRGVAFDASGRLVVAGQRRALYVAEGNKWSLRRYPPGTANVVAVASAPDGTSYVVSAHGRILTHTSGVFRDLSVTGLTADMQAGEWRGAWLSATSKTLWIASKKHIIGVDLVQNSATAHEIPLFFGADIFAGARIASTDLIVVGNMKDFGLFDGTGFYRVEAEGMFAGAAMSIDTKEATLYTADHDGSKSSPLKHPALGTGPGEPIVNP
jgi:hypothetical protein